MIRNRLYRRSVLKAAGVCLAIPMLDAMTAPFARASLLSAPQAPKRQIFLNASLGFHGPHFFPTGKGQDFTLSPYLEYLKDFREQLTVIAGLSHPEQNGINGHSSALTWLTSAPRPGLAGFRNSISIDQLIVQHVGSQTRVPYLSLNNGGDSLSWTANGVSIPAENSPSRLFRKLFVQGSPSEVSSQVQKIELGRSILDAVNDRAKKLQSQVSAQDRAKLDQYFTSVRELESKMQQNEAWIKRPKPTVPAQLPSDVENRNDTIAQQKLMYDLIALALQSDSTRTVAYNIGGHSSVPVVEGVSNGWHGLSHHGLNPEKVKELSLVEAAEFEALAGLLKQLKDFKEGDGSLLDQTCVMLGSNLGNASSHDWRNLPILVVGGNFKHGQSLAFDPKNNVPLANLFVTFAQRMGVEVDQFGSSQKSSIPGLELV